MSTPPTFLVGHGIFTLNDEITSSSSQLVELTTSQLVESVL